MYTSTFVRPECRIVIVRGLVRSIWSLEQTNFKILDMKLWGNSGLLEEGISNDREGYVCATYQKRGRKGCPSHFIRHDELKETVLADLRQLSKNALDRDSLVEKALKKANEKSSQALTELKVIQKKTQQLQQEQLELVRAMTRKMIDDDTFQMSNKALKDEQHALKARTTILETILSQGEANERIMQQFREEVRRFAELQIDDEEALREVLQRLIERIEIELDGGIVIHYNFGNPLSAGA